ncbi:MAG: 50S ribosomal protein L11 methyltransferase [Maribacter sp.]|nr:50S ribosomal protein L11 methyltransferase [Maribacter sp.]
MSNTLYIEYTFTVTPLQPTADILIAELGEAGFESFVENDTGIQAYIQKNDWHNTILNDVEVLRNPRFKISYIFKEIEQQNWNVTWEQYFKPITVGDHCGVRAPFHEKSKVTYDIVIEPKMSFGTGHHETTHMMLQCILEHGFDGKTVLDMGCGTGVLAILTEMKGAKAIDAIDIDHWCYLNAKENVDRNSCTNINVLEGDSRLLKNRKYDVILANINRNILLEDIPFFSKCLNEPGVLFLSGFYSDDIPLITEKCNENGLKLEKILKKNNWVATKYVF